MPVGPSTFHMLHTLSLRFDPVEDRLLLRLVLQAEGEAMTEHWLHLTRRVCAAWRQDLQAMVDLSAQAPQRLDGLAKAAVSKSHHEAMVNQAKIRSVPAQELPAAPARPDLVTKVVCGRRRSDERWTIRFERRGLSTISLVLGPRTLHGLVDAVSQRLRSASWALPPMAAESPAPAKAPQSERLH